jgi:hypothetical protein
LNYTRIRTLHLGVSIAFFVTLIFFLWNIILGLFNVVAIKIATLKKLPAGLSHSRFVPLKLSIWCDVLVKETFSEQKAQFSIVRRVLINIGVDFFHKGRKY